MQHIQLLVESYNWVADQKGPFFFFGELSSTMLNRVFIKNFSQYVPLLLWRGEDKTYKL